MAVSRGHALRNYVIRRLLLMIPTFVGITIIVFSLCMTVPGGPIAQLKLRLAGGGGSGEAGARGGAKEQLVIPEKQLKMLEEYYGFDNPVKSYFKYVGNLLTLDLGTSFRYSEPVKKVIGERLPVSLYYGIITTIFTYAVCIPLGILKAIKHRTLVDNLSSVLIFIGYAIPGFALGAVLLVIFSVKYDVFPIGGFQGEGAADLPFTARWLDRIHHSILPLICYLVGGFAVTTMLMKNSLMENMSADYVKTALAKGVTWKKTVFVHALRNSLIPLATSFGHLLSIILAGSLLIERVFNIRGVGLLNFEAIQSRDYPVVMGIVAIGSLLLLVGNLLSDLCVAFVDPRVRFE